MNSTKLILLVCFIAVKEACSSSNPGLAILDTINPFLMALPHTIFLLICGQPIFHYIILLCVKKNVIVCHITATVAPRQIALSFSMYPT